MFWIILSAIAIIGLFVALGLDTVKEKWSLRFRQVLSVFGLILLFPSFISTVPANSVGILYSPFTGVSEITLGEGFHGKNPFAKVYKISTEVKSQTLENVYTQTSDSQYITSIIDIKYSIEPSNAFVVFKQFRTLEAMSQSLISPTVQRTMDLITTKYNVIDILGEKRSDVYSQLNSNLTEEFLKYGIKFDSATIIDMDAGDAIEKAIEAEAVAKKAVETAEQEYLKAQTQAKQKTVDAQADQEAVKIQSETSIIKAQGELEATKVKSETEVVKAKAEKEVNELLTKSLSDTVLYKMWIEKWDGQLSKITSGDNGLMFDIGSLVK